MSKSKPVPCWMVEVEVVGVMGHAVEESLGLAAVRLMEGTGRQPTHALLHREHYDAVCKSFFPDKEPARGLTVATPAGQVSVLAGDVPLGLVRCYSRAGF